MRARVVLSLIAALANSPSHQALQSCLAALATP